jgi:hypothetical protein
MVKFRPTGPDVDIRHQLTEALTAAHRRIATVLAGQLLLRAETSDDKLVAIVSHLHAVADAVEDLIWVQRHAAGSSASWLSPAARESLVRQDMAGGLFSLL